MQGWYVVEGLGEWMEAEGRGGKGWMGWVGRTIRKNPNASWKAVMLCSLRYASSIWKPPGVRMMAKESQKPP